MNLHAGPMSHDKFYCFTPNKAVTTKDVVLNASMNDKTSTLFLTTENNWLTLHATNAYKTVAWRRYQFINFEEDLFELQIVEVVVGGLVFTVMDWQLWGLWFKPRPEMWVAISYPPASTRQLSYDEYTACTLSVERWDGEGENWPLALICWS